MKPGEWARVPCKHCKGTGRIKRPKRHTYRTMTDGRRRPCCPSCQGFGYHVTSLTPTTEPDKSTS